ncbi:hypothetical protein AcV5_006256 [Taiwanofungus camphoratus]|nr:hypothetical protein AcV5_006256 [Antrodia cinnamomea]
MSRFRPVRASPPLKPSTVPAAAFAKDLLDDSRSSAISIPELVGLTPEEVAFIEDVIERAPATATTFLTVFKAYNDILQERGLDPQNEVVYYGKLLKLGTLRGKNWGEKWAIIKQQQGYVANVGSSSRRTTRVTRTALTSTKITSRLTSGLKKPQPEDTLTLHSHFDDAETVQTVQTEQSQADVDQYHNTPRPVRRSASPTFTVTTNSLGLDTGPPATSYHPQSIRRSHPTQRPVSTKLSHQWDDKASEVTDDTINPPSTIPPSYGAAIRDTAPLRRIPYSTPFSSSKAILSRTASSSLSPHQSVPIHQVIAQSKERKNSTINEDDAWNKIRESQDYKEADRFREDKLLERCWDVWKQGYQWIITTHEQIAQARDNLILRLSLHRWRQRTASRYELYQRISGLSDRRRLKAAFQLWKVRVKEKRHTDWRRSMRARMKTIRENREAKLKKDAWAKWRQSYRSHLSGQHYSERLVLRSFRWWRERLGKLDQLDAAADHFTYAQEEGLIEKCWDSWRRALDMHRTERVMAERVGLRIIGQAIDVWKQRLHCNRIADEFYDKIAVRRALGAWKAARDRIKISEGRASKHLARQNDILVRAVMRVWKAHERGKLLERVKTARQLKQAWAVWKRRVRHQRALEDLALAFSVRSSLALLSSALHKWRQVYSSYQNARAFAVHYHSAQLRFKMLLIWRIHLRANLKMVKQAKATQRFFVQRTYWRKWVAKLSQKRLDKKFNDFNGRIVKKYFYEWLEFAQLQRQRKLAEEIIRHRVDLRIMTNALILWTNRVADSKFRELETTQKLEKKLLTTAFKKWKTLCIRHVEELSLMESYQDVKREENMRRMFYRWLTAARQARHRRLYLQEKEEEMKLTVVAGAWDKWRERFQDIRLQPIADDFLCQNRKILMFRAFELWRSKTKSLPAVRFHASRAKVKAWRIWRDAMPRALQAKTAREVDRQSVLAKIFVKWHKAYNTKIELKAVARARYLRLPTVPRQIIERPQSNITPQASRAAFLGRGVRASSPMTDSAPGASTKAPRSRPFTGRFGIATLLTSRSRSPEHPARGSRPKLSTRGTSTREPSPARTESTSGLATRYPDSRPNAAGSTTSAGEVRRSSLWQELRGVQLRSRPMSERARSREPP